MTRKKSTAKLLAASITPIVFLLIALRVWFAVPGYDFQPGYWIVEDAYLKHRSNLMVEVSGTVVRKLSDQHSINVNQRFVIVLPNEQMITLLHDLSYAERVPVTIDDEVTVRGEYLWTETGGVIRGSHWDSSFSRLHGWIDHKGIRYD